MDIEGLEEVVILDRQFQIAASYSRDNSEIELPDEEWLSTLRGFKPREAGDTFQYVYPIFTQRKENGRGNVVRLGATYVSFSKKAIFDPIVHAQKIAISSAAGILFCSVIGILIISRKLTHQIKLLSDGARQVGYGNLDVEIDVRSNDELGQLTSEFNKMTQHLREKTQMQKFMSPLTVDMIRNTMGRNGERSKAAKKDVSVLFSDVRKFSTIAEQLAPEEIVKLVNVYFNLQTQVIESHNGIVDKFMGDQIMAIFQGHDMADDALRAAVEIQRKIRLLNQERQAEKKVVLEMGIGINNGPAVLGNMGSTNRMDYTVIGDVVNVASRLCTAAKSGQIIASLELAKRVNSSYPTSRLKSISVKGRRKAIEVCEVDYDRDILT
jgi:adenylate cyclase